MSSKLQQALNVTLDDYIAEKGIVSSLRPKPNPNPATFKRQLRSEMEEEEDDDLLVKETAEMELGELPDECEIKTEENEHEKRPPSVSVQVDANADSRMFITEERKRGIKNMPSQQWRLQRQNQVHSKPAGVPPLMAVKKLFDQNTEQLIASLGENAKYSSPEARNRFIGRLNNQRSNRNNNNRNSDNRSNNNYNNRNNDNRNNNNHNNRNWNNRNRNYQPRNFNNVPSFNPQSDRLRLPNRPQMNEISDLRSFISHPSGPSQALSHSSANFGQPQLVTFADMLNRIGQASSVQERETFADVFCNIMRNQQQQPVQPGAMVQMMNPNQLAQMNSNELMPYAANTLFNHITTVCQNFGPKYDMKVQKDIHALQGKAMLYRSSGVVTMDGPGIGNERVTPTTTDLSMNLRFC